jgi:hypothetical protein
MHDYAITPPTHTLWHIHIPTHTHTHTHTHTDAPRLYTHTLPYTHSIAALIDEMMITRCNEKSITDVIVILRVKKGDIETSTVENLSYIFWERNIRTRK